MFTYDYFQKKAIEHIDNGNSVLVSAPTGAGKTVIAEYVIEKCLKNNESVIYTAPIKALSNQKFRDFRSGFGNKIGILTGDVSLDPDSPVMIMTTEIFRNKLLSEKASLEKYSWIIFDEIHYLDNEERGTVWEESIIFLPEHMKILALSATVPNIYELAEWIKKIHNLKLEVVVEKRRPVPLHIFYQAQGGIVDNLEKVKKIAYSQKHYNFYKGRKYSSDSLKPNRITDLIKHLEMAKGLPCIYFVFGRRRSEELAESLGEFNFLSEEESKQILGLYNSLCEKFDILSEPGVELLKPLVARGIAYHHAGMLPTVKEVIERLFTSRFIKVIFTTETFALGINMPAKSVVFDGLRKFDGKSFTSIKVRDFYQMAGRAGRRGIDEEGFVYCRINPLEIDFDRVNHIIHGKPENVVSQFNTAYATVLHLYQELGERLYDIYERTFHCFQCKDSGHGDRLKQIRAQVSLLKEMGYIRKNKLTQKGLFASQMFGYELILSELHERKFLDKINEYELGIIILSLVYEPRRGLARRIIPSRYKILEKTVGNIEREIRKKEFRYNIKPGIKKNSFQLSEAFNFWMGNEEFGEILRFTEADEGEIVRYFRMTIQLLRELRDNVYSSDNLKKNARRVLQNICRDVVDAESQLRIE